MRTRTLWYVLGALTAIAVTGSPSFAVRPVKSIFTTLDRNHCEVLAQQPSTGRLRCEGLPGYPVTIAEEALKSFVSVGTDAENRKAASQTLTAPNSLFKDGSHRATVEWRFVIRDEKPEPYAMIVRYFTKSQTKRGQVLVVTRVTDSEACHVAYIDAVANTNAIILARRIADEKARKFDCKSDPARVGAVGKSPM